VAVGRIWNQSYIEGRHEAFQVLPLAVRRARLSIMSTIAAIEAAIENLPAPQVDELADWLETLRARRATPPSVESWLEHARGAARPNVTTANVMALTRGEE
jgi:hypothetical protein